ncbi:Folate transporter 1, chloroplastic [Orobanche hederae]
MGADWQWENAAAGSAAGLATATFTHPLDVVRTRFQVNDGRLSNLPTYKNTPQAIYTIARAEGLRGLYAGFYPAVLGSTISWGLYFYFYNKAKQRYLRSREELSPGLHIASAAEAGGLGLFLHQSYLAGENKVAASDSTTSSSIFWFSWDALRTILKEEGWRALYKGLVPGLFLVTHGAIQFTAYEELRRKLIKFRTEENEKLIKFRTEENERNSNIADISLDSVDYAVLGASSKLAAVALTYPSQVIRARLQQRPNTEGIPRYMDSLHVVKETAR